MCFRWNAVALLSSFHTVGHSKFIAFIFSGAIGGSNSNLEQARGYTSLPLAALQPNVSAPGSRAMHTSRPMAAPVANRPLSPHLPLKKPQFSATFSISHRIFGVALGVAIICPSCHQVQPDVWCLRVNCHIDDSDFCRCFIIWFMLKLTLGVVGITSSSCSQTWVISKTAK